jgi:methylmalonyl-CoA mutase
MTKPVLSDFPIPSLHEWAEATKKSLKGRDVSALDKKTEDGLNIHALYVPDDRTYPALAPANRDFLIRPRIDLPDINDARAQVTEEIDNGCGGLIFTAQGAPAQGFGIALNSVDDVKRLLDGLPAEKISMRLETGNDLEVTRAFLQAGFARMHPGFDFIGQAACRGEFPGLDKDYAAALALLEKYKPEGAAFTVDARLYHNAGASDAQELGFMLATAVENLRHMDRLGLPLDRGLRRMSLLLATDARQFMSIAKLRAARLLWARFSEILIGEAQPVHVSAETSYRMLTAKDPHTNLLRNTIAAFAALIGGAEKITVLPFTSALGLSDGFARRMARNTLHLLRDEAHVANVQDAARGAAYVEDITLQLCDAAWKIFQEIEKQGGMLKALAAGIVQRLILEKREARLKAYRIDEKKLVGITAFADPAPRDVGVLKKFSARAKTSPLALSLMRDAEGLEKNDGKKGEAAA